MGVRLIGVLLVFVEDVDVDDLHEVRQCHATWDLATIVTFWVLGMKDEGGNDCVRFGVKHMQDYMISTRCDGALLWCLRG